MSNGASSGTSGAGEEGDLMAVLDRWGDFDVPRVGVGVGEERRESLYFERARERSAALVETTVRACSRSSRESVPDGEETTIWNEMAYEYRDCITLEQDDTRPRQACP